jgi:hypothetical protein
MPTKGVEPSLCCQNSDLNAARLPIPPSGLSDDNVYNSKSFRKREGLFTKNLS